ncbi:HetP family heterocyst commitment protein [bacterium]|nr:HetP family heterocyst commitment protein [bacterium]
MTSRFSQGMTQSMTEDQFCQVVDAILNGKYSWACLLILQFSGYNPLHYIPYRTYNRLMKENSQPRRGRQQPGDHAQHPSLTVDNLPYLYAKDKVPSQVRGGFRDYKFSDLSHFFRMVKP